MIDIFSLEINARNIPPERLKAFQEAFLAGWGDRPIGTKEQIVDVAAGAVARRCRRRAARLAALRAGMREFRDVTYPLLRQTGLREFG